AIGADICVSGASVVGEGIRIIDLCGNDVTRLNGNLAPGVYVVAKDGMAKKVIIR
ncbi:MAG: hypothetical protein HUJ90_00110, partial [Bacteroidales bacterium]|nr:hypothetical protein [Bacteroidales bacterium]